jgi:hypothetical protein
VVGALRRAGGGDEFFFGEDSLRDRGVENFQVINDLCWINDLMLRLDEHVNEKSCGWH